MYRRAAHSAPLVFFASGVVFFGPSNLEITSFKQNSYRRFHYAVALLQQQSVENCTNCDIVRVNDG